MRKKCEKCGNEYNAKRKVQKYCTRECQYNSYKMKKIKIKKIIPMCFSSSLIQQNFGESIKSHGYLIWDVETRTYIEKDVENRYGFYQFKIKSLDELEEGTETLTNG